MALASVNWINTPTSSGRWLWESPITHKVHHVLVYIESQDCRIHFSNGLIYNLVDLDGLWLQD